MAKILEATKGGGAYFKVKLQFDNGEVADHWMHESEYKLKVFEDAHIGQPITQSLLDEHKDLVRDVVSHERWQEECD